MNLSARYIHDRKLPDKAIDVLDEAGAAQRILGARCAPRHRADAAAGDPQVGPEAGGIDRAARRTKFFMALSRALAFSLFGAIGKAAARLVRPAHAVKAVFTVHP